MLTQSHVHGNYPLFAKSAGLAEEARGLKMSFRYTKFATPSTPSFERLPFETQSVTRNVSYAPFSAQKGAALFVGVRGSQTGGFAPSAVKKVFEIQ
ncbi:MAG: hypothetical protein ACYC2R_05965 [Burkholderiales bacterium]